MRPLATFICAFTLCGLPAAAVAATLPPPPQPLEGAPLKWLIKPTYMDRSIAADNFNSPEGWAEVECVVNGRGRLTDCQVIRVGKQRGYIDRYVLRMAGEFKAGKTDTAGQPSTGRRVRYVDGMAGYTSP